LLLSLYFCVKCFVDRCLSFCPSVRSGDLVAQCFLFCEVFVDYCLCLCPSGLSGDLVSQCLLFCEVFCRSLFVPLSFRS
jgi:hypothetical protein